MTDWPINRNWEDFNRRLTESVKGLGQKEQVRLGGPLALSVWETVMGLARSFPHRRQIVYFKDQDPVHDHVVMALAKEGYEVISLAFEDLSDPEKYLAALTSQTLLFLYSADDPFFALSYQGLGIEEAATATRTFAVQVSHHSHRQKLWSPLRSPYCIQILSYGGDQSCVRLGEKARIAGLVSPLLKWESADLNDLLQQMATIDPGDKTLVKSFEEKKIAGGNPLLSSEQNRYFDRAVIFWEDLDGHALIHFLAEELGETLQAPGDENRFETTSLSRWQGVKTMDWLKKRGLSPAQLRGTVLIHHRQLTAKMESALGLAHAKVMKLQGG